MQLLYVANRYERKPDLQRWLDGGLILVCDRYTASSIAYGEAFGLDRGLADRDSEVSAAAVADDHARHRARDRRQRKAVDRDRYERDLALLARVRESYRRQAAARGSGCVLDGERAEGHVAAECSRAACGHDSGCRKRAHLARPRLLQHQRAGLERRARRAHVVDEHDDPFDRIAAGRGARGQTRR